MNSNVFSSGRSVSRVLSSTKKISPILSASYSSNKKSTKPTVVFDSAQDGNNSDEIFAKFKDELGLIRYHNFPLPGNTTLIDQYRQLKTPPIKTSLCIDNISQESSPENQKNNQQILIIQQFLQKNRLDMDMIAKSSAKLMNVIECSAHECPDLLKKDFADLFPGINLSEKPLTVITILQKTSNDMSTWSEQVETEREDLLINFVGAAEEMCQKLKSAGFWADFVDPCSGRPYFGSFTNATMFETDDRYRHFGFTIDDLNCCKVISHNKYGRHAFVGVVFTSATKDSQHLQQYLHNKASDDGGQPPVITVEQAS
jgi:hypothetical protein